MSFYEIKNKCLFFDKRTGKFIEPEIFTLNTEKIVYFYTGFSDKVVIVLDNGTEISVDEKEYQELDEFLINENLRRLKEEDEYKAAKNEETK